MKLDGDISLHIGKRLKLRCKVLKMSQVECSKAVGCSFQQIQKYMFAQNRISSGNLYLLSIALKVPITYFYEGLPGFEALNDEPMQSNEVLDLVAAYNRIKDPKNKRSIYNLAVGLK